MLTLCFSLKREIFIVFEIQYKALGNLFCLFAQKFPDSKHIS